MARSALIAEHDIAAQRRTAHIATSKVPGDRQLTHAQVTKQQIQ